MKNDTVELPPRPFRFTRTEYYTIGDAGVFKDKRVELFDGEIIVMSPQKPPHGGLTAKLTDKFHKLVPAGLVVRCQLPLDLGNRMEPEPDISISRGTYDEFLKRHPKHAELVIEIANASANYDRTKKGSLYAKAKIPEFWLINLFDKCLEVYRKPIKAKGHFFGFKYDSVQILKSGETITPLCLPGIKIAVKEMLP